MTPARTYFAGSQPGTSAAKAGSDGDLNAGLKARTTRSGPISSPVRPARAECYAGNAFHAEPGIARTELSHWHRADVLHARAGAEPGARHRAPSRRRRQRRGACLPAGIVSYAVLLSARRRSAVRSG